MSLVITERMKARMLFEWNTGYSITEIADGLGMHESMVGYTLCKMDDAGDYVHDYLAHLKARGRRQWLEKQQPIIVG